MGDALIVRGSGTAPLEIPGQQVVTGKYTETITKFDTVFANLIPGSPEWDSSFTKLTNPTTLPTNGASGAAFSNDSNETYLAISNFDSPRINIYKRNGDTFTKLANPAVLPGSSARSVTFSDDDTYLAMGLTNAPRIFIYKRNGDTFTKLADPSGTLGTREATGISFSPNANYVATTDANNPFLHIFKRNGDTFTKLANPATLPHGYAMKVEFSKDDTYLAMTFGFASGGNGVVNIYKRNGDTFTKLADPSPVSVSSSGSRGLAFSNDGNYLAVGYGGSNANPYVSVYKRNGDAFTKLPDLTQTRTDIFSADDLNFTFDDKYLAVAFSTNTAPNLVMYERNQDTFTQLNNIIDNTSNTGASGVSFSSLGTYVATSWSNTPYMAIYKTTIGPETTAIVKANNLLTAPATNTTDAGYALQDGTVDETKTIMSIFRP